MGRARTAELEESHTRLLESEQRRSLAIAAGKMGSWDWDWVNGDWMWDEGQYQILGLDPGKFDLTPANIQALFHPDDVQELHEAWASFARGEIIRNEFRIIRPPASARCRVRRGEHRKGGRVIPSGGVTVDTPSASRPKTHSAGAGVDHRARTRCAAQSSSV